MLKKTFLLSSLLMLTIAQPALSTNIIVALDELLFTIDQKALNSFLGHENWSTKIGFWWHGGYCSKGELVKDIMEKLNAIAPQRRLSIEQQAFYSQEKVSPIFCEWILGYRTAKDIQRTILNYLSENDSLPSWIKTKFIEMAKICLDPQKLMEVVHEVPEGVSLLKSFSKTQRHQVFILSNCPREVFDSLNTKFPNIFSLFSGSAISSKIGKMKPYAPIYQYLLDEYDLSAQDCLYIGTTVDGLKVAQQLGMQTILWDPYNYAPGIAQLRQKGILD